MIDSRMLVLMLRSYHSFNCSCPEGMKLSDDATKCEDIDECELNTPCSHICENTEKRFAVGIKFNFLLRLFRNFFSQFHLQMSRRLRTQ